MWIIVPFLVLVIVIGAGWVFATILESKTTPVILESKPNPAVLEQRGLKTTALHANKQDAPLKAYGDAPDVNLYFTNKTNKTIDIEFIARIFSNTWVRRIEPNAQISIRWELACDTLALSIYEFQKDRYSGGGWMYNWSPACSTLQNTDKGATYFTIEPNDLSSHDNKYKVVFQSYRPF